MGAHMSIEGLHEVCGHLQGQLTAAINVHRGDG